MTDDVKGFMARLDKAANHVGMSMQRFQSELGYSNSYFRNMGKVNYDASKRINDKFPQINVDWINTGEGEMIIPSQMNCYVPLLPVSAQGGSLTDFEISINNYDCEKVVSPIKGADLAIPVTGDSMSPEYPSGCTAFIKRIDETIFIDWGKTYVLDTPNGVIIKNIFPCASDENKVVCRSVNPNFPDFEVKKEDVRGWYRVLMMMALK